jgi:hypothetical protein
MKPLVDCASRNPSLFGFAEAARRRLSGKSHKLRVAALMSLAFMTLNAAAVPAQTTVLAHKGAQLDGTLNDTLDSGKDPNGKTFTLTEHEGFFVKNPALKGATIDGHIENVTPANGMKLQKATMSIVIDDIKMPDGSVVTPVQIGIKSLKELEPKTHKLRDSAVIVGSAVAGHFVSKKTGHSGGTLAGAATGFALVNTMKSNIVLKRGTLIRMKVNDDIVPAAPAS